MFHRRLCFRFDLFKLDRPVCFICDLYYLFILYTFLFFRLLLLDVSIIWGHTDTRGATLKVA